MCISHALGFGLSLTFFMFLIGGTPVEGITMWAEWIKVIRKVEDANSGAVSLACKKGMAVDAVHEKILDLL
ncbi:hypothetical protein KSF_075940 [Reticulibacter mediterranei]|uniref:Uncharacterized protein n=1 Tax=Reticulibacter mediterranei TaxID=2778369 RepID=A0A8J3IWW6_9CHLR|nr:hypothetical protein KSF_075940 [Reticulibacter mediterranei]